MNPKAKLTAYAVLLILSAWFAWGFYSNYSAVTKAAAEGGANPPAATPDTAANTNNPANTNAATNAAAAPETNAASAPETNAAATPETNAATAPDTNAAATTGASAPSNQANGPAPVPQAIPKPAAVPDASLARGSMIGYLAALVGALIGLGLLIAHDVTQYAGSQAVDFLLNDVGEAFRDPEYERAEAEWANGKYLDAIQMMRNFLEKNPRAIHAAVRIAEIYEKDLKSDLAAALEYEEVLKHKLPAEKWGWTAIHLCNLYSRLNQTGKSQALLRRVAGEYPRTAAAKKARAHLGLLKPEPEAVQEESRDEVESEATEENPVITVEARPPELEPRWQTPRPPPREPPEPPEPPEPSKPSLPPGFRPK